VSRIRPKQILLVVLVVATINAVWGDVANAENRRSVPIIGEVWLSEPVVATPYSNAFHDGLRRLGYIDGSTITIMPRFAYGDPSRLPNLISELLAANVDVLYVTPRAIPDAVRITRTVPIVSMGFADPVVEGFVASLARPERI
jgi:ABC-type uncharacterized transport system substrate-binding protein